MVSIEKDLREQVSQAYFEKYGTICQDLCHRIVSQINLGNFHPSFSPSHVNLNSCFSWRKTKEGEYFWDELYSLDYYGRLTPETVEGVYIKHNIPFVPNQYNYEVWLT